MNKSIKWTSAILAAGVLIGGQGIVGGTSVNAESARGNTVIEAVQQPSVVLQYKREYHDPYNRTSGCPRPSH